MAPVITGTLLLSLFTSFTISSPVASNSSIDSVSAFNTTGLSYDLTGPSGPIDAPLRSAKCGPKSRYFLPSACQEVFKGFDHKGLPAIPMTFHTFDMPEGWGHKSCVVVLDVAGDTEEEKRKVPLDGNDVFAMNDIAVVSPPIISHMGRWVADAIEHLLIKGSATRLARRYWTAAIRRESIPFTEGDMHKLGTKVSSR